MIAILPIRIKLKIKLGTRSADYWNRNLKVYTIRY